MYGSAQLSRLAKSQWLEFALNVLAREGYGALKAQTLAAGLGVTRGSFYWHFEDLAAFKRDLIQHWTSVTTERLIADLGDAGTPQDRLAALLKRTLRSGERLERAVRSWATVDDHVAGLVASVDARRIAYAEELLLAARVPPGDAAARARLMYWAAIGRLMMADVAGQDLSDAEVDRLAALMSAAPPS